jgi:polysaccharide chain length determinant protein (PEP-CTERM system associated)
MVRNGDITLSDAQRILRRFWWITALSTLVCAGVGLAAALLLPKRFTSQTIILVEQPAVPMDYVKPIITEDLNRRLASMQQQILSRTRLQPVIEKFDLYSKDRQKLSMDELVAKLRTAVKVSPMESMPGTESRQLPGFFVDVEFGSPKLAQQICSEITSMFLEQNTREREQQAVQTTAFLSQQLEDAKTKLDQQDGRLAQFKRQYLGSLPEEEQTNLSLLTGMNSQLEANSQALSRAEQDRAFNETLLGQQELNAKATQTGQTTEANEVELDALEKQLAVFLARYTPKHPDVVKLEVQIEELKKRQSESPKHDAANDARGAGRATPQTQQLHAKIRQDEISIADLTKRQSQIQEQIHQLQARVQASPVVEQQLKELTRSYQAALDFYNELLKKRQNSAMATDLEQHQESERFKVLDPPNFPDNPSFPNKILFTGGGFAAGLAIGLGVLYLIAFNDKSLHTQTDVEKCLKLPVLALIPALEWGPESDSNATGSALVDMGLKRSS